MSCIDTFLSILLKVTSLFGLGFIFCKYKEIKDIDRKIEAIENKYKMEVRSQYGAGSAGWYCDEKDISQSKDNIYKEKDREIEVLERKRRNIISIIPFLK